jgi:hypothetical protein
MDLPRLTVPVLPRRPLLRVLVGAALVWMVLLPGVPAHAEDLSARTPTTGTVSGPERAGSAEVRSTPAGLTTIGAAGLLVGLLLLAPPVLRRLGRLDEDQPAARTGAPVGRRGVGS